MSLEGQSVQKKQKTSNWSWCVTITSPQTFKMLLNVMNGILSTVTFQLCVDEVWDVGAISFTGLRADSMNSSQTCVVKVAYECRVELSNSFQRELQTNPEHARFCVNTQIMRNLLHDVQNTHVVDIMCKDTFDNSLPYLELRTSNTQNSTWTVMRLPLVEDEFGHIPNLQDITYNYFVTMSLDSFKDVNRILHCIHTNTIEFRLEQSSEGDHFFTIRGEQDRASVEKIFHSHVNRDTEVRDSGTASTSVTVFEHSDNDSSLDDYYDKTLSKIFHERYEIKYVSSVLKHMDSKSVVFYMNKTVVDAQSNPMMMSFNIGNDNSYLRVLVCSMHEEEF
jgi:hypothetical protein